MGSSEEKTPFLDNRLSLLQKTLDKSSAYIIENPDDLFYFCGKVMSCGTLFVFANECYLFVDGRYISAVKSLHHLKVQLYYSEYEKNLLAEKKVKTLYFDGTVTNYQRAESLQKNAGISVVNKPSFVTPLRRIKDSSEIALMKKSASLLYSCYEKLFSHIREGMTERELSNIFKITAIEKGASNFSFEPIIAFGENSAFPHHRSSERKLKKGDIILIDIGVEKDHYQSDMTRVAFFGNVSQELMKIHDVVLAAHDAALKKCRKGALVKDLDLAAREVMKKEGLEPYFTHGLGHGIGIETHESPRMKFDGAEKDVVLETGMVITIEPGLYLEGKGGVRYEDTIVITNDGYENFFPGKQFKSL